MKKDLTSLAVEAIREGGYSRRALARKAGVSLSWLQSVATGRCENASIDHVQKVLDAVKHRPRGRLSIIDSIAHRIRTCGYTREEFAEEAGVSKSWVNKVCARQSHHNIKVEQAQLALDALDRLDKRLKRKLSNHI